MWRSPQGMPKLVGILLTASAGLIQAQSLSPYSTFQGLNSQQFATLQVKLTYLGVQDKILPSLGYSVTGDAFNLARFTPFYRSGFNYVNDSKIKTFTMSAAEAQAIVMQVGNVSGVTAGGVSPNPFVSFSISAMVGGSNKVFEAIVDAATVAQVFGALRTALANVPPLLSTLTIMACPAALTQSG